MFKKLVAILLAGIMLLSFTSCGNTSWVVKSDDNSVSSGIYLGYMVEQIIRQLQEQNAASVDALLKMTVEEKKMPDYIKDAAVKNSKKYLTIEKKFAELNLTLSDEDLATVDSSLSSYLSYYGNYFEDNGCSSASLKQLLTNNIKADRIFNYYYGEGGEKEVKTDDIKAYFKENYALCRYIQFSTVDSTTGEDLADDKLEAVKSSADNYLKRAKNGEDFISLVEEYKKSQGETVEEDAKKEGDNGLTGYDYIVNKESETYDEDLVSAIFALENGAVDMITVDDAIYVVLKRDILENEKIYNTYSSGLLSAMKGEEFDGTLDTWTEADTYTVNESAVKRYAPKKIKVL